MQAQARSILPPAIAALAVSFSVFMASPLNSAANAAETCLAAPKGTAPQGSHWYYRLERGSQRKCWRLVQKDQKNQRAVTQTDPQGDADEETEPAAATPAVTPPAAKKSAGRLTEPAPKTAQALVTKDASDTTDATPPVPWPDPPAAMTQRVDAPSPPAPLEQTQNDAPAPAAIAQQPIQQPTQQPVQQPTRQPVAAADSAATVAAAGGTSALQFVFVVIALLGLLACAIFYIASVRRRRTDVLNKAQHLNALPAEVPAAADAPTFQPLPPMDLMLRHDDVEEAMQRFAERWKRRAA
jgi:outer membrane biosynthesis protein TonB